MIAEVRMLANSRLDSLVVYVNDLAESRLFYEERLGLPVLRADADGVALDAGGIRISLRRGRDHGIVLAGRRDDSSDIVFLVEDLEGMRLVLERRGVEFFRRRSYEVGFVTDFYDPNGHRLMLYEPSPTALTWPSAAKVRDIWRTSGHGGSELIGPPAEVTSLEGPGLEQKGLAGKPLVYVFLYENDQMTAYDFYSGTLGLSVLERVHCCNQDCPEEIEGIVKYDGGSVLLSTHHLHENSIVLDDFGQPYSPRELNPEHARGVAPVFTVTDVGGAVRALTERGVPCEVLSASGDAPLARFEDPFGHPFLLALPASIEAGATSVVA